MPDFSNLQRYGFLGEGQFIVILLSKNSVTETFSLIEKLVFPDLMAIVTHGVLYPLGSALVYLFIYPYPSKFVTAFTKRRQKDQNALLKEIEDATLLSVETAPWVDLRT